jgi:hypothetical protein
MVRLAAANLVLALLASLALASDGVLEINQTCATATGCFSGDTAGFPVTLGVPGSYRLTGNLQVPNANTTAIIVKADDVTLDLGGFSIRGVTVCSGNPPATPLTCSPTGDGIGVFVDDSAGFFYTRTEIRNGSVVGMGNYGLLLGDADANIVSNVRVGSSGGAGINVASGGQVIGNMAYRNGASGIQGNPGSILRGNTAYQNGSAGIQGGPGSTIAGNVVYGNRGPGIAASSSSSLEDNTSTRNGSDGISTGAGCLVKRNAASDNTGAGLRLGDRSAYVGNLVNGNGSTVVVDSGTLVNLGENSCDGTATCP